MKEHKKQALTPNHADVCKMFELSDPVSAHAPLFLALAARPIARVSQMTPTEMSPGEIAGRAGILLISNSNHSRRRR